jgi:hypothetical protein
MGIWIEHALRLRRRKIVCFGLACSPFRTTCRHRRLQFEHRHPVNHLLTFLFNQFVATSKLRLHTCS